MSIKNSSDDIGNRTLDIPACSAVPQATAPPRAHNERVRIHHHHHHHHVHERIRFDSCSLYPQNEIGPSISSSVVLCVFVLFVYIVVLVSVSCLCPSSVCVVATFPGTVLFPLLYSLLLFFNLIHWFFFFI